MPAKPKFHIMMEPGSDGEYSVVLTCRTAKQDPIVFEGAEDMDSFVCWLCRSLLR